MARHGNADDLDENFVIENVSGDDDDNLNLESSGQGGKREKNKGKKRKDLEPDVKEASAARDVEIPEDVSVRKKTLSEKKRQQLALLKAASKAKKQRRVANVVDLDSKGVWSPDEQAHIFWGRLRAELGRSLSDLEATADRVKGEHFLSGTSSRNHSLEELPEFIKDVCPTWKKELVAAGTDGEEAGSPAMIVCCASAARAVEVIRALRELGSECKIGKLFAKHMKLEDQVAFLKNVVRIGVGTPKRLEQLCGVGALSLEKVRFLLVDVHKDAKDMTLFDIADVRRDFFLFYSKQIHPQVLAGVTRISLF